MRFVCFRFHFNRCTAAVHVTLGATWLGIIAPFGVLMSTDGLEERSDLAE
jgi:putative copper export protein